MKAVTLKANGHQRRRADADNSALLRVLVNSSPEQIDSYLNEKVTDLVQARAVLLALTLAVRHLYHANRGP